MIIENQLIENQVWSIEEIKNRILPWFEKTKPFHAELLRFTIYPPDREYICPIFTGSVIIDVKNTRIGLELPEVKPSPICAGFATYSGGLETIGLVRPTAAPTLTSVGILTITAKTTQYGTLNAPRPSFEVWPQYLKVGIITRSQRRTTVGPSVPVVAGQFSAGIGVVSTQYTTIRQEAY